jgi:hypothetical protein
MLIPLTIFIMLLYGFMLGIKITWRTFLTVSLFIMIFLSVIAAMLIEAVDPGDASFIGTVFGAMLLLAMIGTIGILGFVLAHYGLKRRILLLTTKGVRRND